MKTQDFEIRTYGFGELAQLYFPNVSKMSASHTFTKWIYRSHHLFSKLTRTGWKKGQKYFTPKQVKVLIRHFDPPI